MNTIDAAAAPRRACSLPVTELAAAQLSAALDPPTAAADATATVASVVAAEFAAAVSAPSATTAAATVATRAAVPAEAASWPTTQAPSASVANAATVDAQLRTLHHRLVRADRRLWKRRDPGRAHGDAA